MTVKVLIVDDDRSVREALVQTLMLEGLEPLSAGSFVEAKDHITRDFDGVILSDMRMTGRDGFHLLGFAQGIDAELPVVLLTGEGDIPMAVKAMGAGAFDFLEKPSGAEELTGSVLRALKARGLVLENLRLKAEVKAAEAKALVSADVMAHAEGGLVAQLAQVEKTLLIAALERHAGKASVVAKELKLPRKTLYDKLARYDIKPEDYRS